mgnify:CR=1 FL=1|tara:strand:+ start:296 stop:673 length:378 start_codon:yes stop_codon:yes gene_type:complete
MAKNYPDYTGGKPKLEREIEITDNVQIAFWFNIDDADLRARLDAYYKQNKEDWKKQPGLQLQVKVGENYHDVCKSRLWIREGSAPQQQAVAPAPAPAPVPPPIVSMEPSFDPSPAPPPPEGYGNG